MGVLDEGQEVDHLCHNKLCANPAHLQAVDETEHRTITAFRARELHKSRALFPDLELEWRAVDRSLPTMEALRYAMAYGLPFFAMGAWRNAHGSEGVRAV